MLLPTRQHTTRFAWGWEFSWGMRLWVLKQDSLRQTQITGHLTINRPSYLAPSVPSIFTNSFFHWDIMTYTTVILNQCNGTFQTISKPHLIGFQCGGHDNLMAHWDSLEEREIVQNTPSPKFIISSLLPSFLQTYCLPSSPGSQGFREMKSNFSLLRIYP